MQNASRDYTCIHLNQLQLYIYMLCVVSRKVNIAIEFVMRLKMSTLYMLIIVFSRLYNAKTKFSVVLRYLGK